jgi:hypothetical protein
MEDLNAPKLMVTPHTIIHSGDMLALNDDYLAGNIIVSIYWQLQVPMLPHAVSPVQRDAATERCLSRRC